jgi:hypothetical protein
MYINNKSHRTTPPRRPLVNAKLKTKNGFMFRYFYQGFFYWFFTNKKLQYVNWKLTIEHPDHPLPDFREYNRLKYEAGLEQSFLTGDEIVAAGRIAKILESDPYHFFVKEAWNKVLQAPKAVSNKQKRQSRKKFAKTKKTATVIVMSCDSGHGTIGSLPGFGLLKRKIASN